VIKSLKLISVYLLLIFAIAVWLSCSGDDNGTDPHNKAPIITSITADPDTVYEGGGSTTVTVTAEDPDDDPLTYIWGDDGNLQDMPGLPGNTMRFQTCCDIDEPITAVVYSTVQDGRGGEAHDSVHVQILPMELP
jgi:hypothetical protein